MVKMKAPEGMKGFNHAGVAYTVSEAGTVDVPDHAVETMQSHGLVVHVPKETKREKK